MPSAVLQTAGDLLGFREPGKTAELVRGKLIVREPPSTSHGVIAGRLFFQVMEYARKHDLGAVIPQDTGFKIEHDPDTVRAPDVAFVTRERLTQIPDTGYAALAPDWIAEILSPNDRPGEVLDKIGQWLSAGVRLVWVIDPQRRHARIYRSDGSIALVGPDDELDGEDVFPGLRCPLRDIV
ncbi:MAG TPA: Uma2 family endonuclease [Gemmatimonadales bacterium]|nr:Uma2 family endonuclease [Gemmatimonadales bacterium]